MRLKPCNHIHHFVVIDLASQIHAIRAYTSGWSSEDVLAWLAIYGHVRFFEFGNVSGYSFYSSVMSGMIFHIWFDADNRIRIR